jgi:Ubiquitin carboxyl-terminal hydrolase
MIIHLPVKHDLLLEDYVKSFTGYVLRDAEVCQCGLLFKSSYSLTLGDYVIFSITRATEDGKLTSHVPFPARFNHHDTYTLRCVIEHIGVNVDTGHYVAWVNRRLHLDRFFLVDDDKVATWTTFEGTPASRGVKFVQAALLLYQRL